ncbi:MAG: Gfo/Idh/MocA family oxidoreductase, partial [Defluviitaleaceae bacterium]|nr:Gfo/Idh/MocA family oxidoreductase [Defluviitaleaceae bacterium]
MLRIAVLSKWHAHAWGYADQIRKSGKAEIAAIWDEVPERGRAWANELNVDFEGNLDALLARPDIDAIDITSPTTLHEAIMTKA